MGGPRGGLGLGGPVRQRRGKPHRDRNRIAQHEALPLPPDPAEALKAAQEDLRAHLEEYIEAYRAAKAQGRQGW